MLHELPKENGKFYLQENKEAHISQAMFMQEPSWDFENVCHLLQQQHMWCLGTHIAFLLAML